MMTLPSPYTPKALLITILMVSAINSGCVQAQNEYQDPGFSSPVVSLNQQGGKQILEQGELEQLLAPIALYPDTILSHVLVAATYPLEVVQAERWVLQRPELQGQEAVEAAQGNNWDPSVQALVAFPEILKRMSRDLEWTQKLGQAFVENEEQVLASIQNLRVLAEQAGSLDKMENVTVTRDQPTTVIIIEPRERHGMYVPYYDTRIVYGSWRWDRYQPVFWDYPYAYGAYRNGYYAYDGRSSFYWGPRTSLSFGFYSNAFHWGNHHIVRIPSRHYQPHRYYSHNDIISHRHAQRWVHDQRRDHNNQRSYLSNNQRSNLQGQELGSRVADQRDNRNAADQLGQRSNRQAVQNRLENLRRNAVNTKPVQGVGTVTNATRPVRSGSPAIGSSRVRAIEADRRDINRQQAQPTNRQTMLRPTVSQAAQPTARVQAQPTMQRSVQAAPSQTTRTTTQPVQQRSVRAEQKTTSTRAQAPAQKKNPNQRRQPR